MIRRNFIKKAALAGIAVPSGLFNPLGPLSHGTNDDENGLKSSFESYIKEKSGSTYKKIIPVEINDILSNPGVGWETASRVATEDKNLPSWIPSRVCYYRWGWDKFEPEQGRIDTGFINGILKQAHDANQTLAIRVMAAYPGRKVHPDWLEKIGGKINYVTVFIDGQNHPNNPVADFDDPVVLQSHLDFIEKLGILYDGHPDLDHVDLGSLGWWGEWHLSGTKDMQMPSIETHKKIIDAYLNAFTKTPLVMLIGASRTKMLQYATERGAGWRADCFGDMNYHMVRYYTQALSSNNAMDAWKKGPVAWESCWEAKKWVAEGWPLRFIFNYGIALHGSVINNKSATLPPGEEVKAEIVRFLQRLGYRFVLKELNHPVKVKSGKVLDLNMKWQNMGSAPCYKPYRLAYKLSSEKIKTEKIIVSEIKANQWMPGDMEFNVQEYLKNPVDLPPGEVYDIKDSVALPADLKQGKYKFSVGIVGVDSDKPVVQLGIKGRTDDGWYPLSEITITR